MPKTIDNETAVLYGLHKKFLLEPLQLRILIHHFGSAQAVLDRRDELTDFAPGSHRRISAALDALNPDECLRELLRMQSDGIQVITHTDGCWPLAGKDDTLHLPLMLFVRSTDDTATVLDPSRRFISVVGTRDPSVHGIDTTASIVSQITAEPRTFISGLAIGIDTKVHRTALDNGIPTIAVLPCGLDTVYPICNRRTADRIAAAPGSALISQFPNGTAPHPVNFLTRNHVTAFLGKETILVESKSKGGALVTARLAGCYGNTVYAVPGRPGDIRSEGCNQLIRELNASLFTGLPERTPDNR